MRYHSSLLDCIIGFDVNQIEAELFKRERESSSDEKFELWDFNRSNGNQTWIGLDPQVMLTPYCEQFEIAKKLNLKKHTLVDLGCGYGRMGLFFKNFFPSAKFLGHEVVAERVIEANRIFETLKIDNAHVFHSDITDPSFELPDADIFFIYDFGHPAQIKMMLDRLSALADIKSITVVARGKGIQSIIFYHHPWLFSLHDPEIASNYTIFRS